jgi:uncharacterized protein YybS (DUF2232 family)
MLAVYLSYYVPALAVLLVLFSIPCTIMGYRYSVVESVVFLGVMTAFLIIIKDMVSIIPVLTSGLCGVSMGYMLKARQPATDIVKYGFLVTFISLVGVFGVYSKFFHMNILQEFADYLPKIVQTTMDTYKSVGIGGQDLKVLKSVLDQTVKFIGMSIPFDILLYSVATALAGFMLTGLFLKHADIPRLKPFSQWTVSRKLVYVFIVVYIIEAILHANNTVYMVTFNILLALSAVFIVEGYSLLAFFMKRRGMRPWLQVLIVLISLYIPIFVFILMGAGVLDSSFDFRHLKRKG